MNALAYAHDKRDEALDELKEFLRIPSVSTLSEHKPDIERAAVWLAAQLERAGLENVAISPTDGYPIVVADWLHAPGKPTVLIYGHYDVQPADPLELWRTPPFEPTERDGKLYARGAADDKGQIYIHVKALEALLRSDAALPVNVKIMFEGEEEIGSDNLAAWIAAHEEELKADVVVISDSHILSEDQPAIVYGLRGLSYIEVHVETSRDDLHSGTYGGAVHNPIVALAEIIAQLHDENGTITVPGFYEKVRPLDPQERSDFAKIPVNESTLVAETGIPQAWGEKEFTVVERLTARPTLEPNGIWGGFTGEGAKTVLPARASAKISMRLVPDQDPGEIAKLVSEHIRRIAPHTVRVEVRELHHGPGAIVPRDIPAMKAASEAYEEIFGKPPIFMREGGSIPVVALFQQRMGMNSVLMGFGLPDDNLHAPNEKLNINMFYRGIETAITFYQKMGQTQ